jgi:Skp family chaperone for outer membrane proteins
LAGAALLLSSGLAQAACEDMSVIVRNSVYPIRGLEAFCTEFNKMKADLAGMRSELTIAKRENAMLRARLTDTSAQLRNERLARSHPVQRKESQTWKN